MSRTQGWTAQMVKTTKYWPPERAGEGLAEAARMLAAGGVVAFPTETVYGLGADARSTAAVGRIFEAKGRPSDNPLIVHAASLPDALSLAERADELATRLAERFWPGPLTLVLPVRAGAVSPKVTAGLDTVAVRVPDHELARRLIASAGCPVAAPSANRSGRPSPTRAAHVLADLDGRIDGVLDGGATGVGLESTVVRVLDGAVHVLRPGGVTAEQLREAAGPGVPVLAGESGDAPRSPGVKYAHYAPRGEMLLVVGDPERRRAAVQAAADEAAAGGRRVGILSCAEHAGAYRAEAVLPLGSLADPAAAARALYARLRECDERQLDYIVAEGFPEEGLGAALMNRLAKAAGGRVRRV